MKKFLVAILLGTSLFAKADIVTVPIPGAPGLNITVGTGVNALPLQDIRNTPGAQNITMGDDDWRNVPLQHQFPYFGQTFTNSWMLSNGAVTFQDPARNAGGMCCSGMNLSTLRDTRYNYTIFPLWADLIANGGSHWVKPEANQTTYGWYGVAEYYNNNRQSFEVNINSSGAINTRIGGALITGHPVTSGMTGDLSQGQYYQYYFGNGINIQNVSWSALGGTSDQCVANPLSSPTCPNYATAYLNQQCTISPLYNPSCPGYADAYFNQQCSINPLYNSNCPGYSDAYFNQQCSLDPLYNINCPGYAQAYLTAQCNVNPLYSTTCAGYETAYFNQQCSLNPLYNSRCPGYAQAYLSQQCSINALYSTTCSGYADAYFNQQCSISGLYSNRCPNYQQAYFADQCSKNGLYDTKCPNYATAYATWLALQPVATTTNATTTSSNTTTPTTVSSDVSSVPIIKDSTVNGVITSTATSVSPATAATTTVPLVTAPATTTTTVTTTQSTKEEKKDASSSSVSSSSTTQTTSGTENKSESPKPTARQELQAKREAAAKAKAIEDGKNLASEMGKSADMETQKQVQNVVIQAMGYTPGFDVYRTVIVPDSMGYKPFTVYGGQKNVDNRRLGMGLYGPSDKLHNELVDSQYKTGNNQ